MSISPNDIQNNCDLISSNKTNEKFSTNNRVKEATPVKDDNTAQRFFSFKSNQEINYIKEGNNNSSKKNSNKNYLSISVNKSNSKNANQNINETSRKLSSSSAKKNAVRQSFFGTSTSRNLNESCEQPRSKSKLSIRENRNSVLFDIMRSAFIDKNANRKYLATAKDKGKREKNKFNIYDSSDDSDAEICKINKN